MQPDYFNLAPCCFFAFDDNGIIKEANQTLCTLTGYSREDLINVPLEKIFTVATKVFYQTHFFPILKLQGSAEEIYITLRTSKGEQLPLLCNTSKALNKPEAIYSCVGILVHNRKKFEDELINAKKTAEKALNENTELNKIKAELIQHSEKLDRTLTMVNRQNLELRQFNRAVTHDLQEPLRKISLFMNMMQDGTSDITFWNKDKIAEKVLQIAKDMQEVVYGLQQYVWVHERGSHFVNIDLNTILNSVQTQLTEEEGENSFQLDAEELPDYQGDRSQIYLLFYHLMKNAIKFRKEGEKANIKISATITKHNNYKNLKDRYSYNDHLKIEVEDKGIGFDPVYKTEIFDLFKKLHHNEGRGVGLALCRMIVENHHGQIFADSCPGEGTAISIILPVGINVGENSKDI